MSSLMIFYVTCCSITTIIILVMFILDFDSFKESPLDNLIGAFGTILVSPLCLGFIVIELIKTAYRKYKENKAKNYFVPYTLFEGPDDVSPY